MNRGVKTHTRLKYLSLAKVCSLNKQVSVPISDNCLWHEQNNKPKNRNTRQKTRRVNIKTSLIFKHEVAFSGHKRPSICCHTLALVMYLFTRSWSIHTFALTKACLGRMLSDGHHHRSDLRSFWGDHLCVSVCCLSISGLVRRHFFQCYKKSDIATKHDDLSTTSASWQTGQNRAQKGAKLGPKTGLKKVPKSVQKQGFWTSAKVPN